MRLSSATGIRSALQQTATTLSVSHLLPPHPLFPTPHYFCRVRRAKGPVIVACPDGGTSIEDLAESNPELILKVWCGLHGMYVRVSERWGVGWSWARARVALPIYGGRRFVYLVYFMVVAAVGVVPLRVPQLEPYGILVRQAALWPKEWPKVLPALGSRWGFGRARWGEGGDVRSHMERYGRWR